MLDDQPPAWRRVDQLVDELRARVERRRDEGAYPPGVEADLDGHFRRIAAHRVVPELDELNAKLAALELRMGFSPSRIPTGSRMIGGSALHRLLNKLVARQTQGVLEQMQEFADGVRDVLQSMKEALEHPFGHVHADLLGQVDAVVERMSHFERGQVDATVAAMAHRELTNRVESLEAAERRRDFRPWFSNERFEDAFRGGREEMLERYRDLAAHVGDVGPVLEIGCGRGEFLELLAELDAPARGVELDPELAKLASGKGLDVTAGNGLTVLAEAEDDSLGGLVLIQVIEHLTPQEVVELVALAADKLAPGGRLLVETVNPQSLYVFARAFYVDPTHSQPVHPAYLEFLCREAGFEGVRIDWRSPTPESEALVELDSRAAASAKENVRRLNQILFGPQDYALIAYR